LDGELRQIEQRADQLRAERDVIGFGSNGSTSAYSAENPTTIEGLYLLRYAQEAHGERIIAGRTMTSAVTANAHRRRLAN
jgi:hypothetical protein